MSWQLLATIQTSTSWVMTPITGGQLFRIRSANNNSSIYLKAVIAQVLEEFGDFTVFDSRRISYKSETESFLFVPPQSLSFRKLAVKRLDDSNEPWNLEIEELDAGGINLPIYLSDISGLSDALADKADSSHNHAIAGVTGLTEALGAKADSSHNHAIATITGLTEALGAKADSSHNHAIATITGLTEALGAKADSSHNHAIAGVTGLTEALGAKADSSHNHAIATITGLTEALTLKTAISSGIVNFTGNSTGQLPIIVPLVPNYKFIVLSWGVSGRSNVASSSTDYFTFELQSLTGAGTAIAITGIAPLEMPKNLTTNTSFFALSQDLNILLTFAQSSTGFRGFSLKGSKIGAAGLAAQNIGYWVNYKWEPL